MKGTFSSNNDSFAKPISHISSTVSHVVAIWRSQRLLHITVPKINFSNTFSLSLIQMTAYWLLSLVISFTEYIVYLFNMKTELIFAVKMLSLFFPSKRYLMVSSMFPLYITLFYTCIMPQTNLSIFLEHLLPIPLSKCLQMVGI